MLGRLMMVFMIPMILYFTIYPGLKQMSDDIANCNVSSYSNVSFFLNNFQNQSPPGKTASFGGAGGDDYRFGGYTGKVTHREFPINQIVVTNETSANECYGLDESQRNLISMMPLIFLITSGIVSYFFYRHFFYYSFIGDDI